MSVSTVDLGYSVANKVYVNESLTEKNKELLRLCLKCKNDLSYKFLWTNAGRIFLRKNLSVPNAPLYISDNFDKNLFFNRHSYLRQCHLLHNLHSLQKVIHR